MNNDNMTFSREQLERMSTDRLDDILYAELRIDPPDGDLIRLILDVLENRERGLMPENDEQIQTAWDYYLNPKDSGRAKFWQSGWFMRAVAVIALVCILFSVIPQSVEAEGLFDRFVQWTDSFFQLLRSGDREERTREYVFQTDNPGLQQVYDAAIELGITEPVVPMWMPGDGELTTIDEVRTRDVSYITAMFSDSINGIEYALMQISQYSKNAPSEYAKDEVDSETYEIEGMEYRIVSNDGKWVAICTKDNLEYCIRIQCQKDDLYRMIDSIYMMEVN